jgi:hypothetical protein
MKSLLKYAILGANIEASFDGRFIGVLDANSLSVFNSPLSSYS